MLMLSELQKNFFQYLTHGKSEIIENITNQGNIDSETRLNIYKNAYFIRLKNSIEHDHENLGIYLGDDLFDKMVDGYINQTPSQYTSLRDYCKDLPDYLRNTEPFKYIPVIAEIAEFESILINAFDAKDCHTASLKDLQSLAAESWPKLKLTFHPSVTVFQTEWNSVEIWQAIKNKQTPAESKKQRNYWMVWRDTELLTQYKSISTDALILHNCLRDNYTFADACELLLDYFPEDEIAPRTLQYLQGWLQAGMIEKIYTK